MILEDLEKELLIALLYYKDAYLSTRFYISEGSFKNKSFSKIYKCIKDYIENDDTNEVDVKTILALLNDAQLEQIVINLYSQTPSKQYLYFAKQLHYQDLLQKQKELALMINEKANKQELVSLDSIMAAFPTRKDTIFKTLKDYAEENHNKEVARFSTSISFLDRLLGGGVELGSFILISGEPEAGKSSLGLQIIEHIAKKHKVMHFCFEFTIAQYFRAKQKSDTFIDENKRFMNYSQNMLITADYTKLEDLAAIIVRAKNEHNCNFFFIDSQMRIENAAATSLEQEESQKFSTLAKLAHRLEICILLVVQTSKTDTQNPAGTKKGAHEANIIIRVETLKNKDGTINANKRVLILQKNKQTGIHAKEVVGFDFITRTFTSNNNQESIIVG